MNEFVEYLIVLQVNLERSTRFNETPDVRNVNAAWNAIRSFTKELDYADIRTEITFEQYLDFELALMHATERTVEAANKLKGGE